MGKTANYDNIDIDKNNVLFFQISLSNDLLNMYEIDDIVQLLETEDDGGVKYLVYFDNRPYIDDNGLSKNPDYLKFIFKYGSNESYSEKPLESG